MTVVTSKFSKELFRREEFLRFYMLVFDASIERDPVLATRDFLLDNKEALKPSKHTAPQSIRMIYLRRKTYGKSALTDDEIAQLLNALERPDENTIRIVRELVHDHLCLCKDAGSTIAKLVECLIDAVEGPKAKGRKVEYQQDRNSVIFRATKRLIMAGLNKTGEDKSACSIVSDELCRMGFPLSHDAVRKIFDVASQAPEPREEIDLALAKMKELWGDDWTANHRKGMAQLEDLGKKLGYIHSSDAT